MQENGCNFYELVKKLEENQILLPDFQREFVWKSEDRQRRVVASVLAKMPIGSILLLKSQPDEFVSKCVGSRIEVDLSNTTNEIEFLLDGQQRITVLTNVFSNAIHERCPYVSKLNSTSLKRRFFLKIPKLEFATEENDLFGIRNFQFPIQNPATSDPKFLTYQILDLISYEQFKGNGCEPYNPAVKLSQSLDNYCIGSDQKYYLVPLFLLVDLKRQGDLVECTYKRIVKKIARSVNDDIISNYEELKTEKKEHYLTELKLDDESKKNVLGGSQSLEAVLEERVDLWIGHFNTYLNSCLFTMKLNLIEVEQSDRARAIDIYENLNLGGVSLSTFDLIMAKVAKVDKDNFYQRIINNIINEKSYKEDYIPECMRKYAKKGILDKTYNASVSMEAVNDNQNEISSSYINIFLNVLALYCNDEDFQPDKIDKKYMKQDEILKLDQYKIHDNCEKVCTAIDRACFFLQMRCGIRKLKEVNYSLIVTIVAYIFVNDEWFESVKNHELLEAWYWSVLFSGEFDVDQNARMEANLKRLVKTIQGNRGIHWLNDMREKILDDKNFSDKEFLLLENAKETERYPKRILRMFIAQYFLSKTYTDMFDKNLNLNVRIEDSTKLELHHIVPLATAKKIGESTRTLRDKDSNLLNSPVNFVYITSKANKEISSKTLGEYQNLITPEAAADLHFSGYSSSSTEKDIRNILEARFIAIKGDIGSHVNKLLYEWKGACVEDV